MKPTFSSVLKHFLILKLEETYYFWVIILLPFILGFFIPFKSPKYASYIYESELFLFFAELYYVWLKGLLVILVTIIVVGSIILFLTWLNSNWKEAKRLAVAEAKKE